MSAHFRLEVVIIFVNRGAGGQATNPLHRLQTTARTSLDVNVVKQDQKQSVGEKCADRRELL
jgi:hypothetical protein